MHLPSFLIDVKERLKEMSEKPKKAESVRIRTLRRFRVNIAAAEEQ
jgi:hypothetical protein